MVIAKMGKSPQTGAEDDTGEAQTTGTGVPDMAALSNINIEGINENLHSRYDRDDVYAWTVNQTYSGSILIAVNPYKELSIYETNSVWEYCGQKLGERPPHIFAIAEAAYVSLKRAGMNNDAAVNQSVVISGESGAGKTETTRFILEYLCQVTSNVSTWVEHQILEANTILEAFGNAKTVRNDNSSRFGKFMQVCFDIDWKIRGCIIQDYLLEQSRITFQSPDERNYHVFYQLVAGATANPELAAQFNLKKAEDYNYLSQSGCIHLTGVNDRTKFDSLRLAFSVLQVPQEFCDGIFSTLSAILWLGNLKFEDIDGEKCCQSEVDLQIIETIAKLLGLRVEDVSHVTLLRQINVRGNITEIPLKVHEARENRHAMAKALYSRTFAWLINHINTCTNPGQDSSNFLGLLDIFGFENFKINSFEQLCINYTNEKLHKFFNHYVFALEQEIYRADGIKFNHISFTDNTTCLELIEKPPRCILKLLTEQCHMPKGSDGSYLQNLHSEFAETNPCYVKGEDRRHWESQFGIIHYAGTVFYNIDGFVEKNRDVVQDLFFHFLEDSSNTFVKQLSGYKDLLGSTLARVVSGSAPICSINGGTTVSRNTSKGKPTVGDAFRQQLQALVDVLQATTPWYVRCIKPNMYKLPSTYDDTLVLDQLKYLGMMEIIRIRREGYPIHFPISDFVRRYKIIDKFLTRKDHRETATAILKSKNMGVTDWQIGNTKVFLRSKIYEVLEEQRCAILARKATIIQRTWKGFKIRKDFTRRKKAVKIIQQFYWGWKLRLEFLKKRRAAIAIQAHLRGFFAREVAGALREMRRVEEEIRRREIKRHSVGSADELLKKNIGAELSKLSAEIKTNLNAGEGPERKSLDNLYEFLSEVHSMNGFSGDSDDGKSLKSGGDIMQELGDQMDALVSNLEDELESQSVGGSSSLLNQGSVFSMEDDFEDETAMAKSSVSADDDSSTPSPRSQSPPALPPPDIFTQEPQKPPMVPPMPPPMPSASLPVVVPVPVPVSVSVPVPVPNRNQPSLPEPTVPPPPPPLPTTAIPNKLTPVHNTKSNFSPVCNGHAHGLSHPHTHGPGPTVNGHNHGHPHAIAIGQKRPDEPIYESIKPRPCERQPTNGTQKSSPPSSATAAAPPATNGIPKRSVTNSGEQPMKNVTVNGHVPNKIISSKSNQAPPAPTSPKLNSRPSSCSSTVSNGVQSTHSWKYMGKVNEENVSSDPNAPIDPNDKNARRKQRIEKKLQELDEEAAETNKENEYFDLIEYAKQYFNHFERGDNIMATLTRRKSTEAVPKCDMISYTKHCNINNSHVHLYDPDNVQVACFMFRDLGKYMRGELKQETELMAVQTIIGYGIEREELRDEIFVQLMRQCNNNPNLEYLERLWLLFCLCVVSFPPGKLLQKYVVSFIKKNLESASNEKLQQQMQWCLENCVKMNNRKLPPSSVEIAAMRRLGTIVCRFFFLDGRTKAIDIQPTDTAQQAMVKLASKIGLSSLEGWSIYESRQDFEEHVPAHHYIYDVIAGWEGHTIANSSQKDSKKNSHSLGCGDNRFIFKKRLFRQSRDIPQDPVEVTLLYAQAVFSVVKKDEYPVAEKVALQLAGLQSQVALGDPKGLEHYANVESYMPTRISRTRPHQQWVPILYQAHRQYGSGKSELVSKVWYLSCVMQYPLYGTTMFPVVYRGYWLYGNSLVLGINSDGICMIKEDDKFIMYEYSWPQIDSVSIESLEKIVTIKLSRSLPPDTHKCFVFETKSANEIGALISSYCPALSNSADSSRANVHRVKAVTNDDRLRLYQNILNSRKQLIDSDLLRKPTDNIASNIINTLRRMSKHKLEKLRQEYEADNIYKGYPYSYWAFSKYQLNQPLTKMPEQDEPIALQVNQLLLSYSGLITSGNATPPTEEESAGVLQSMLEKCWKNNGLLAELYVQLIKQTTDHPEPNSRINIRNWAALSLVCSVLVPPDPTIRRYLFCHLKKCGADCVTEEGHYARFSERCLLQTLNSGTRRQWPPSKQEIISTINRRLVNTRIFLMDGKFHTTYFGPNETAADVLALLISKVGLPDSAKGYAIYETGNNGWERSLISEEKLVEVMARWERQRLAAIATSSQQLNFKFVLKKHLFIDIYMNLSDPVEKELLHHQLLHCARNDRFPISDTEAAMLVALQAQVELGDYRSSSAGEFPDYCHVSAHCLPTRIAASVSHEAVARHHQSLVSTPVAEAKQAVLNLLHSWPLHRAAIFDVGQSFTSNWPRTLWLAVDQVGVHLLQQRSRNTLCSFNYELIVSYSPSHTHFMLITSIDAEVPKPSKIILTTTQGYQISQLIKEYIDVVFETAAEEGA